MLELQSDNQATENLSSLLLVGRIISCRTVSENHVRNVLKQVWNLAFNFKIKPLSKVKNTFTFTFSHERDKIRVLNSILWSANNSLLILKSWSPHQKIKEVEFISSLFQVQIHGLPLNQMTKQNVSASGNLQVWNFAFHFKIKPLSEVKNTFIFTFSHERDKTRVLNSISQSVNNSFLILKRQSHQQKIKEVEFI